MLKTYRVGAHEIQHGSITVEAGTKDEALEIAQSLIEEYGMTSDWKVFDREFEACVAEELL